MIVGNKSGGAERRVGIWDKLDVHGSLGVDASATAQNVDAKGSVTVGDKAWMKNDGSVYASSKLGVGVSTDDGAFARRQMLVRGGRADDWQAQLTNVNGSRNVYMNHGDGYGMHINTNDQRGDRYGLEIHNGSGATFQVFNDGRIRGYGKNSGDWNDVQMNPNGGGVYMNHGQGYGMHINSRNTEDGKYGLEVHNGSRTTFKVRNSGHVDVAETLTANNINTNNVQSGVLRANSHLCIGGTCIDEGTLRRMRDSGSGITNGTRVRLQSSQTGRNLENGGGSTGGATVGAYGWDGHINKTWWIYNA
jgi:hypothetical protein